MDPTVLAGAIIILLFSVIVHEVMHGLAALYYGDRTAQNAGRLTLNPIPHIDPLGTVLLPVLLIATGSPVVFGWAKPVPINPLNFRNIRQGELVTSLAGILSNFALAIVAAIIFHLASKVAPINLLLLLKFTVDINLILGVFNLLPIPPLDGSKVVMSYLPYHLLQQYQKVERYGLMILILLWVIPFGNTTLLWSIIGFVLNIFHSILGV